jgi:hypothetical protein
MDHSVKIMLAMAPAKSGFEKVRRQLLETRFGEDDEQQAGQLTETPRSRRISCKFQSIWL